MKKTDTATLTATGEASSTNTVELKIGDPNVILATRQYVDEAIQEVLKKCAPIDSPNFIGTPSAPTLDEGNNSEQIATTAFVKTVGQKLFPERGNGYQELPSGLIFQWGFAEKPNPRGEVITFSNPFPNSVFGVFTTGADGEHRYLETFNVVLLGNESFKLFTAYNGGRNMSPCFWFALGC